MNKKMIITVCVAFVIGIIITVISLTGKNDLSKKTMSGTVMGYSDSILTIAGEDEVVYSCNATNMNFIVGETVMIEYTGILNENYAIQNCEVIGYESVTAEAEDNKISAVNDIFKDYYTLAKNKLKTLSLDEKIGQLLLVRYPDNNAVEALKNYNFGGYVFFEKDFKDKTSNEVKAMINTLQNASKIPILTAVDEEGGTVVRVSSNPNLAVSKYRSSSEVYTDGGLDAIRADTLNKSKMLYNLGLNLNLAPVVDVSTDPNDYMYNRTLKQNTSITSNFAKTVVTASKGTGVSYTLKHFPGYGSNADTHLGGATDNRSYEEILETDIPPFIAGIEAGAEAILVSHNIVNSIDNTRPASLSKAVHNMLRNELNFTGIIITDDIAMGATKDIGDASVQAVLAGNNLLITTDYEESFNSIKNAVSSSKISENQIDELVLKNLAWKYYKSLINDNEK